MAGKMGKFVIIFFVAAICLTSMVSAVDAEINPTIQVGLFYGQNALPGANLENYTGSGYRLGYFDEDLHFVTLGHTPETQISMVKTQNVSLSNGNYVDGTGSVTVGCYHLQMPGSYPDFESAAAAAAALQGAFPAWIEGAYFVRVGAYATKEAATAAQNTLGLSDASVTGTSSYGVTVVATKTGRPLFQFDGGASYTLGVKPGLDDATEMVTWFKGYRYYGSFRYVRESGGNLSVINVVPLEDYVRGVLPYEMSNDWPLEALKAQAVCARTYAYMNLGKHQKSGFDICNTTDCQVYQGAGLSNTRTDQAAAETYGKYVWYAGELAQTYYFSCDGGATEDVKNVWGSSGQNLPYLTGVVDIYEPSVADKTGKYNWTVTFTKQELKDILHKKGYLCDDIVDFYVAEYTPTGNVYKITFLDAAGKSWSFVNTTKEYARTLLGLNSIRYTISSGGGKFFVNDSSTTIASASGAYAVDGAGNITAITGTPYVITGSGTEQLVSSSAGNSFTITGSGWGHNVGMSQWGAYAMAEQGKTYDEILKFYFTGVDVR